MEDIKLSMDQLLEAEFQICRSINFISDEQIKFENWSSAMELVYDIDNKDVSYILFQNNLKQRFGGDKVLINGLALKGFKNSITTNEL